MLKALKHPSGIRTVDRVAELVGANVGEPDVAAPLRRGRVEDARKQALAWPRAVEPFRRRLVFSVRGIMNKTFVT
jgi:hypothetical protein